MRVFSIAKGFHSLAKHAYPDLSQKELDRVRAIRLWRQSKDTRLVCETFGISRARLYRWIQRFDPKDLSCLKEKSRRPRTLRKPTWSHELIMTVKGGYAGSILDGEKRNSRRCVERIGLGCLGIDGRTYPEVPEGSRGYRGTSQEGDLGKETTAEAALRRKETKRVYLGKPWRPCPDRYP